MKTRLIWDKSVNDKQSFHYPKTQKLNLGPESAGLLFITGILSQILEGILRPYTAKSQHGT